MTTDRSGSCKQKSATPPAAAAAPPAYPPWVMLERNCTSEVLGCFPSIGDATTLAGGHTTAGVPIGVSLCLAAPPEGSRTCLHLPDGVKVWQPSSVLAAHGGSVLLLVAVPPHPHQRQEDITVDHFVYNAGDAAAGAPRPPSLSLLPPCCASDSDRGGRVLRRDRDATGLLCRGEDEFVVARLRMVFDRDSEMRKVPELTLFRSGRGEWSLERPLLSCYDHGVKWPPAQISHGSGDLASASWSCDTVIPFGDRLCWVDLVLGLLFCDVFDESRPAELRYVPLPKDPYFGRVRNRNVCVTAGGGAIKFVNVFPRCCCGDAARAFCRRSGHAYTVRTWTLKTDATAWAWVMDGAVDATQLWALDRYDYEGLPRVQLSYPVVSVDEPHAISFTVCEDYHVDNGDETVWMVTVDVTRKTIRSVFRYPRERRYGGVGELLLPSIVSDCFNVVGKPPRSSSSKPEILQIKLQKTSSSNIDESAQSPGGSCDGLGQASSSTTAADDNSRQAIIMAALKEIPGLDREEMLKAYRILWYDDSGRRFRCLMGLPLDLRKDCVLMEIKASEACVTCSACSADLQLDSEKLTLSLNHGGDI